MKTCPACGKRWGGFYSFSPWCSAQHWALVDNRRWEREQEEKATK